MQQRQEEEEHWTEMGLTEEKKQNKTIRRLINIYEMQCNDDDDGMPVTLQPASHDDDDYAFSLWNVSLSRSLSSPALCYISSSIT